MELGVGDLEEIEEMQKNGGSKKVGIVVNHILSVERGTLVCLDFLLYFSADVDERVFLSAENVEGEIFTGSE